MNWASYIFNHTISFEEKALQIFNHQYANLSIYKQYVDLLKINVNIIKSIDQIPCLPISFFKTHEIISVNKQAQIVFESSGTTGSKASKHFVAESGIYKDAFTRGFQEQYGSLEGYCFLALLPGYLERQNSSLVYMVDYWIKKSNYAQSGFYLNDFKGLNNALLALEAQKIPTILIGVTYALLNFAQAYPSPLATTIIMETGGMKGQRKEMPKAQMHNILKDAFNLTQIHSEYGMTELLSQAYSQENGRFAPSITMRVLPRDIYDALSPSPLGMTSGFNIIDLANVHSCSFISTQDMGKVYKDCSFEVIGRIADSDLRGCNLMIE